MKEKTIKTRNLALALVCFLGIAIMGSFAIFISEEGGQPLSDDLTTLTKASLGNEFNLKINQTAYIRSDNLRIYVSEITDSRCPSDVQCIWQGDTKISIQLTKEKNPMGTVTLTYVPGRESFILTKDYKINVVDVKPIPKSTQKVNENDRVVTLIISPT